MTGLFYDIVGGNHIIGLSEIQAIIPQFFNALNLP
jgi:hypothetical protein